MLQAGSKRRRTKKEIENQKETQLLKEQHIAAKLAQYDALKEKVRIMES